MITTNVNLNPLWCTYLNVVPLKKTEEIIAEDVKETKKELLNFQRNGYIDKPYTGEITGNNIVLTGYNKKADWTLVVLDFDGENIDSDEVVEFMYRKGFYEQDTQSMVSVVRTQSGGVHLYLMVIDTEGYIFNSNKGKGTNTGITGVKAVDVRGEGGCVFGVGTDFTIKGGGKYVLEEGTRPYPVDAKTMKAIYEFLGYTVAGGSTQEQPIINRINGRKYKLSNVRISEFADPLTEDEIRDLRIKSPAKLIIDGKIVIKNQSETTVGTEFNYWKFLWSELAFNYKSDPEMNNVFSRVCATLAKNQPEFQFKETSTQVKSQEYTNPWKYVTVMKYMRQYESLINEYELNCDPEKMLFDKNDPKWVKKISTYIMQARPPIYYVEEKKKWCYWNGAYYSYDTKSVNGIVVHTLESKNLSYTSHARNEVFEYIKLFNTRSIFDFDQDRNIIPMLNGFWLVNEHELIPSDQDYLCLWHINYEYEPVTELTLLNKVYFDNLDDVNRERLLYYCKATLEGNLCNNKLFLVLHGVTGSGKTTLAQKLKKCIGDDYYAQPNKAQLSDKFSTSGSMQDARFVYMEESSAKQMSSDQFSMLKIFTGDGDFTSEKKFCDPITQEVKFSLWIGTNQLFTLPDGEDYKSFFSRCTTVEFTKTFEVDEEFKPMFTKNDMLNREFINYLLTLEKKNINTMQRTNDGRNVKDMWDEKSKPVYYLAKKLFKPNEGTSIKVDYVNRLMREYSNGITIENNGQQMNKHLKQALEEMGASCRKIDGRNRVTGEGNQFYTYQNITITDVVDKKYIDWVYNYNHNEILTPKEHEHLINGSVLDTIESEMKQDGLLSYGK